MPLLTLPEAGSLALSVRAKALVFEDPALWRSSRGSGNRAEPRRGAHHWRDRHR